jgi:hypothetical protein
MSQEDEVAVRRVDDEPQVSDIADRSLLDDELSDLIATEEAPASVTYTSQDFDIAGLVRRLEAGTLIVPNYGTTDPTVLTAGFQRGFVWTRAQMDRFIESLLLGYPIPSIFLVRQSTNKRMLVLDGQQRLVTLQKFYRGIHDGKEFALKYVSDEFRDLTYESLDESVRIALDDSYMQATIVAADGSDELNSVVYQIFERLNAGGTQLTPHEIRVALYAGPFMTYLEELNSNADWRELYGKPSARIRDQEVILRTLAFYLDRESYSRPLKGFLNAFTARHAQADEDVRSAGDLFVNACKVLREGPGKSALRRYSTGQVNAAQAEAVLVGVMSNLQRGSLIDNVEGALERLIDDEYFVDSTTRSTAGTEAVADRMAAAISAFRA